MPRTQLLTVGSVLSLVNPHGLYLTAYAWLFGMSVWISFFGGVIAFKSLPRHQFGALQHKTFPIYFVISMLLSSGMLLLWTFSHPDIVNNLHRPRLADVAQAYAIASVLFFQGFNHFVIGPMTSRTMFERQRLEKEEGKAYTEPEVSAEMKRLTRRFGILHGVSSLANLGAIIALAFHGLWIGNAGVKGY
ncbi:hypothetical protein BDQ17DRAFT_1340359 [Cyathus striatus]|nr:hypothetical protein BDQ17DRAFT_1340359 [Cyathus striatus]